MASDICNIMSAPPVQVDPKPLNLPPRPVHAKPGVRVLLRLCRRSLMCLTADQDLFGENGPLNSKHSGPGLLFLKGVTSMGFDVIR